MGLDVAVDEPLGVGVAEAVAHLAQQGQRLGERQGAVASLEAVSEGASLPPAP